MKKIFNLSFLVMVAVLAIVIFLPAVARAIPTTYGQLPPSYTQTPPNTQVPAGGTSQPADPCAQQCVIPAGSATSSDVIAKRKVCDQCRAKQDLENLKTIRTMEDGAQVQQNYDSCKSEYTPEEPGTPPNSAGQYVPVHETGELLTLTQSSNSHLLNIDEWTGGTYDLNVLLCMYLHAIKRVQYAFEDLAFVKEPDMRRQAATKIEEYKQALLGKSGLIKIGYAPSGELAEPAGNGATTGGTIDKTTLYPENLNSYLSDATEEGDLIAADDLKNSGNIFKTDLAKQFAEDKAAPDPGQTSNITTDTYNKFLQGDQTMTTDNWWNTFLTIFDSSRPNNPDTAYLHAQADRQYLMNNARSVALNEYQSGNGFLPVRICIVYTTDGKGCRVWKNITPGTAISQINSGALNARLDEYISPAVGQVGAGNEPTANEGQSFTPSYSGGGGSTGGQVDLNFNLNINQNGNGGSGGGGSGGGGGGGGGNNNQPIVVQIISSDNASLGSRTISWASANTQSCQANNDWVGSASGDLLRLATTIKRRGNSLSTSGDLVFRIPLNFDGYWYKNSDPTTVAGMSTTTNTAKTSLKVVWNVPAPSDNQDTITLRLKDGDSADGYTLTVGGARNPFDQKNAGEVVTYFQNYAATNPNASVYKKYKFTYTTGGTPNIAIELKEPVYEILCQGANGQSQTASSN